MKWITKDEAFEYAIIGAAVGIFLLMFGATAAHAHHRHFACTSSVMHYACRP